MIDHRFFFLTVRHLCSSCQTYEGGFGACPGAEAHGGYSFCGYATLLLLDHESLCDRESLLVREKDEITLNESH